MQFRFSKLLTWMTVSSVSILTACSNPESTLETSCADKTNITPISSLTSNLSSLPTTARVEGIVTYTAADKDGLGGVYLQSSRAQMDDTETTSEGVFVKTDDLRYTVGMRVIVSGAPKATTNGVSLTDSELLSVCATNALSDTDAVSVTLPVESLARYQELSNMWVELPQDLVMSQSYQFGRYGHVGLSSKRLINPTNRYLPDDPKGALLRAENKRDLLIMDDGSNRQNPSSYTPYPVFSGDLRLPTGTVLASVSGVMGEFKGKPILQPILTKPLTWQLPKDDNRELPARKQNTDVRFATFNVLNYFTTLDDRGADNEQELERQTLKTVKAINASNADVIGLVEIENNGYGEDSAIATLVTRLNQNQSPDNFWDYIVPKQSRLGTDSISVAIIFKGQRVMPVGDAIVITATPFDANTRRHRTPLLQVFKSNTSGNTVSFVVNHFKSKGSSCGEGSDDPFQGNCNGDRTAAAKSLITVIKGLVNSEVISEHVIVTGDLNAYSMEDPLQAFANAEYVNVVNNLEGKDSYSYVYSHQSGSLDHILVTKPLSDSAVQGGRWHINADQSRVLDYNLEYKNVQQQQQWYRPDVYRSSDHDPVWLDVKL